MNVDPNGNFFISLIIFGALLGGWLGAIKAAQNNDNILTGFLFGAIVGGIGAAILPASSTGLGAFAAGFGFGFGTDVLEQMIVGGKSFGDVNLIDSLKSGAISGIFNVFSFGIKNSILNSLNKNGEFLGEIMSDIIYSTNFELGSFTTDKIINGFGLNGTFTVNDLRNKIFSKSIYSSSHLSFNY